MQFLPGMSFADTMTNSFHAMPGPNAIFRMRPRGIWLRTVAPKSMLGKTMSSTYCDFPVTLSRPSLRGTDWPTMRSVFMIVFMAQCATGIRSGVDTSRSPTPADGIVYDRLSDNGAEV